MTAQSLRRAFSDADELAARTFELLGIVSRLATAPDTHPDAQLARELVIRALEHRDALGPEREILLALARQGGLFPYLDPATLSAADALAYEAHRPHQVPDARDLVFHAAQAQAYHVLLSGEDLVLMAPTSFGKTLIVDALIASGRYRHVVIVVPTIALIDETRVRLSRRYGDAFKIVTHAGQDLAERNLIVMTQERALELDDERLPRIDLLVVDEFYKLDNKMDPERSALLNQAFHRLRRRARQFYLLGPNVRGLSPRLPADFRPRVISTDFRTIALDVQRVDVPAAERPGRLAQICREHDGPTLIYCRAPAGCRRVAGILDEHGLGVARPDLRPAAAWLAEHVHPDWALPRMLQQGIGIHHAQMPRWLGQYIVRAFNSGRLDYLACTSTLIEGVNTAAKNVVIYENKVGTKDLDVFTFENISGRSGRMWQHFVGRVFHFHPRPGGELQDVDIPILSQPEDADASLLLELPADELTEHSRDRLRAITEQELLPRDVLRGHPGVPPARQLALAEHLAEDPEFYGGDLGWDGMPDRRELRVACDLIWEHLVATKGRRNGIASGAQLAARIDRLRADPGLRGMVTDEVKRAYVKDADEAVESVMQFLRSWADFEFPKLLRCLSDVQRVVLGRAGVRPGEFTAFANQVESLFAPPYLAMLDEYGIPLQLARRLVPALGRPTSLDELLDALRRLELARIRLTPFEHELLIEAQARL
jgi:hypothetical protein